MRFSTFTRQVVHISVLLTDHTVSTDSPIPVAVITPFSSTVNTLSFPVVYRYVYSSASIAPSGNVVTFVFQVSPSIKEITSSGTSVTIMRFTFILVLSSLSSQAAMPDRSKTPVSTNANLLVIYLNVFIIIKN